MGERGARRPGQTQRPPRPREAEVVARWGAGAWLGWTLRAEDGAAYTLLFQGRPGGPSGPDFRDAALVDGDGRRVTGDIEIHLSPSGWWAHGHASDPRYNGVALHVTLWPPGARGLSATPLANGQFAPLVALAAQRAPDGAGPLRQAWPCALMDRAALVQRLEQAGWERFEERVARYTLAEPLRSPPARQARDAARDAAHADADLARWGPADGALFAALAEALGYGRDREGMRLVGALAAQGDSASETLARALASLGAPERRRAAGLLALRERWRATGPAEALATALARGMARAGARGGWNALTEALRRPEGGAISPGRARILGVNVALPALAACRLGRAPDAARSVMAVASGLPSNQITRAMARQLGMTRLPAGALAQQGMHQVWSRHCREKRCEGCPCAPYRGERACAPDDPTE